MMVQVKNASNVVIVTMGRDALHRHVSDTEGTSLKDRFFGLKWQILEVKVGSNTVSRNVWSQAYVDGMILRDRDTDSNGTMDERLYSLQDANWNTTGLVNPSGTVVERDTYTPFGVVTFRDASGSALSASTKDWVFLHQGGEKIAAGNYEFRNRIYSPTLGRWLSNDPLGFDSGDLGWYRGIENNPIIMLDPSGLWSFGGAFGGMVTGGGVGAGVGATVGAPIFGIGALPGAIGGGIIGGIGGFVAGGVFTEPAYSAISGNLDLQISVAEEVGMGILLGAPFGVVGGISGPAGFALTNGSFWTSSSAYYLGLSVPGATMTVSHWGKPGIYPGSWVMVGKPDWLSWILAGGWVVGPYSSGLPYSVPVQSVVLPIGSKIPWYEWTKIWQRTIK